MTQGAEPPSLNHHNMKSEQPDPNSTPNRPKRKLSGLAVKGVVGLLFLTALLWFLDESEVKNAMTGGDKRIKPVAIPVSVVSVQPESLPLDVIATGISEARWLTQVFSPVTGEVSAVPDNLVPGQLVKKGQPLAQFEQTEFRSALAEAKALVADAELQLETVLNEQRVAKGLNTRLSQSKKQHTAFGRLEPHAKAAKARLEAAKAAEQQAIKQLGDTGITSPFDALVLSQNVVAGQWRNAGEELYQLAASVAIDVRIELSASQWQRLGDIQQLSDIQVQAGSVFGQQISWAGHIRYISPVIDPSTRQRSLVIEVLNPYGSDTPLLPDEQVQVFMSGPLQPDLVKAPASALTEDGKVWTVEQGRLTLEEVELFEQSSDHLLLRFSKRPDHPRQLVRFPISTLLEGQQVDALTSSYSKEGAE